MKTGVLFSFKCTPNSVCSLLGVGTLQNQGFSKSWLCDFSFSVVLVFLGRNKRLVCPCLLWGKICSEIPAELGDPPCV